MQSTYLTMVWRDSGEERDAQNASVGILWGAEHCHISGRTHRYWWLRLCLCRLWSAKFEGKKAGNCRSEWSDVSDCYIRPCTPNLRSVASKLLELQPFFVHDHTNNDQHLPWQRRLLWCIWHMHNMYLEGLKPPTKFGVCSFSGCWVLTHWVSGLLDQTQWLCYFLPKNLSHDFKSGLSQIFRSGVTFRDKAWLLSELGDNCDASDRVWPFSKVCDCVWQVWLDRTEASGAAGLCLMDHYSTDYGC